MASPRTARLYVAQEATDMTLDELLDDLLLDGKARGLRSADTMPCCLRHLSRILGGDTDVATIARPALLKYVATRRDERAGHGSLRREMYLLSRAYKLALENEKLERMPFFPKVPDDPTAVRRGYLTLEELHRVVQFMDLDDADIVEFYFAVGWRRSEPLGMTWTKNVDGDTLVICDSKTRRARKIPIAGALVDIMERRKQRRIDGCDLIFHRRGKPHAPKTLLWHFQDSCIRAGVGKRLLHDLRRSFLVHQVVVLGTDIKTAMTLAGWTSISTALRYLIISLKDQASALESAYDRSAGAWRTMESGTHAFQLKRPQARSTGVNRYETIDLRYLC